MENKRKRKIWIFPLPIAIAILIVLLSGGILIYALTKSTEAAGPVGYWKLDEGAGTVAYDASGNANDGTLTNFDFDDDSDWENGKVAGALEFDGTNDYIDCGNNSSLNITSDITIEVWFKANSIGKFHTLVSKGPDTAYNFRIRDTNVVQFYITESDSDLKEAVTTDTITNNTWYHLVGVAEAGGSLKIYINGVLSKTGNTYTDIASTAVNLRVGSRSDGWASGFADGTIDEVRIYNRALSAEEISWNYNRGGPIGWWKFDEGSGTSVKDSSGNNNNGVLGGDGAGTDIPTWTTGKINSALSFDNSDDYIDCGSNSTLDITAELTLEAWVYPLAGQTDTYGAIIYKPNTYLFQVENNRKIYVQYYNGSSWQAIESASALTEGQWSHIVYVQSLSGADRTAVIYINGKLDKSQTLTGSPATSTTILTIGRHTSSNALRFYGYIDDVRIHNYARTAAEIRTDYNFGQAVRFGTGDYDLSYGLVGHWTMDEGSGYTAYDSSNNSNNGTLNNFDFSKDSGWSTGKVAGALQFDGTDDYVQTTISESTTTVALWVENSGIWQHVVNSDGTEYVNGVTGTPTSYPIYFSGTTVQIGKTAVSTYFSGKIDDVRVYNRALSADEVSYLYNRKGPVGWWKFDGELASTTYDSSGNGNNGTIYGATSTVGKINSALSFDGVDDYVDIVDNPSIRDLHDNAFTVGTWIKVMGSGTRVIATKGYSDQQGETRLGWLFILGSDDTLRGFIRDTTGGSASSISNQTLTANVWYYVTLIYDDAGDRKIHLYINGVEVTYSEQTAIPGSIASDSGRVARIGRTVRTTAEYPFSGLIDDVRIYNYTRTAAEIRTDYNEGFAVKFGPSDSTGIDLERGLVSRWKFEEGSGYKAYDSSNGGNDGTLYNFDFNRDSGWTSGNPSAGSGQALKFDGSNDYMETTVSESTTTVAFWVQNSGTWQHVVNSDGTEYVNGVTGSPTSYPIYFSGTTLQIGKTAVSTYFSGKIDDVRIYNRALSADEIRYLYNRKQPIAHWKFDEGNSSGTLAYDSSINGNHGTIYGASSTEGKVNRSLSFDGTDDYVSVSHSTSLNPGTGDWSVGFWWYPNAINDRQDFISKGTGANWLIRARGDLTAGQIQYFIEDTAAVVGNVYINTGVVAGQWNFVFMTLTRSTKTFAVYVNNLAAVTGTYATSPNDVSPTGSLAIGTGNTNTINGKLDDVRIYNYARTADEIRADYNAGMSAYFK